MLNAPIMSNYGELLRVIRHVRNRWRLRLALRGAAIVLAAGLLALAMSAFGIDQLRYSNWAVWAFRERKDFSPEGATATSSADATAAALASLTAPPAFANSSCRDRSNTSPTTCQGLASA